MHCIDCERQAEAVRLRGALESGDPAAPAAIKAELARYKFYHVIEVAPGIETPGIPGNQIYTDHFRAAAASIGFYGKRVIDVGCRDGAMLFMAEEAGAAEVVGIDNDLSPGLVNFLVPFRRSRVETMEANLYDLDPATLGTFDVAVCAGLLYHLRFPVWGLKKLADLLDAGGTLVLETGVLDAFEDFPVIFYPAPLASPYEVTSPTFCNLAALGNMLSACGFEQIKVRDRFNPIRFSAAKHAPAFARKFGDDSRMTITRTILTAAKSAARTRLDAYFEETHGYHSKGAA